MSAASRVFRLQALHETIDYEECFVYGGFRQMRVDRRAPRGDVPEIFLNMAEIDTGFQQMGGIGMSQGMHGRMFVDAGGADDDTEGVGHTLGRQALGGSRESRTGLL